MSNHQSPMVEYQPAGGGNAPQGRSLAQRFFFWLGIAFWVVIFCIPFFFVVLAMRGEMSFGLPDDYPDSRLRIWLVMEPRERGIAYSLPRVVERGADNAALAVQTGVRYLLWEGDEQPIRYCQIYRDVSGVWVQESQYEGECSGGDLDG